MDNTNEEEELEKVYRRIMFPEEPYAPVPNTSSRDELVKWAENVNLGFDRIEWENEYILLFNVIDRYNVIHQFDDDFRVATTETDPDFLFGLVMLYFCDYSYYSRIVLDLKFLKKCGKEDKQKALDILNSRFTSEIKTRFPWIIKKNFNLTRQETRWIKKN